MLKQDISIALKQSGSKLDPAMLHAFIKVESGGKGFDDKTGKILIQFEPSWFRKKAPYAPSGLWSVNKVEVQAKEWLAFSHAFNINPVAAMESTSIGMPQIMGFHYERLGFSYVGDFWDYMKGSLVNQIEMLIKFIETDKNLLKAFNSHDFDKMAYFYNGAGYMAQAHRLGITPYNVQLAEAHKKYAAEYA